MLWRKPRTPQNKEPSGYEGRVFLRGLLPRFLLVIGVAVVMVLPGCRKSKKSFNATEIHAITRELAVAASTAPNAEVRTEQATSDQSPDSRDRLNITLRAYSPDTSGSARVTSLLQSLGRVATLHGLTQDAQSESREGILFNYSRAGHPTHTIHIHLAAVASASARPSATPGQPRLAIILDDLGTDRAAADAIFSLPYALTISVLPNRPHSVDIAENARDRGYEVMLHLPMESVGNGNPESQELRPGMSPSEVASLLSEFVNAVPGVRGVNNHQGSQSTADPALMNDLMRVLHDRQLFYIDSRTTAATVAYDAARQAGVRSAFRNVPFLDDVAEISAVQKQLRLAVHGAKDKGEAIAIGHPHRATLMALQEVLPQAKAEGIQLVFASDLVH